MDSVTIPVLKPKTLTKEDIIDMIDLAHNIQTKIESVKSSIYYDNNLAANPVITNRIDALEKLVDNLADATRHLDEMYLIAHGVSASDYVGLEEESATI